MRILSALDPIRNALGHHNDGRIGIDPYDIGHEGGVRPPPPLSRNLYFAGVGTGMPGIFTFTEPR
jgi:hypothetical protein